MTVPTFTNLGTSAAPDINSDTDASSYSNASWTPPTSGLIVVFVYHRAGTANTPTISGNSLTWTNIASHRDAGGNWRISLFGANASGSSTGATTIDFAGQTQIFCRASFFHVTDADLSGGVAAAFVQTVTGEAGGATSLSLTLAAAGHSDNRPIAGFAHSQNQGKTPRTNWTEIDDVTGSFPNASVETQYRGDAFETTASATWTTSATAVGIAAEIKGASSGGGAYTLTADGATFTQTGQAVNLLAGRKVAADSGAFAHTGQAASLLLGRVIGADSGTYTLTGQDAGLITARLMGADTGAFALTGQDADLVYTPVGGYTLTADAGGYTLTGQAASLLVARLLAADSGSFTLTGQDATLVYQPVGGYTLVANAGTYDLTGQDAALLAARILTANSGAYELTGQAATLARGYLMETAAGSYSVTGQEIGTLLGRVLAADSGAYTFTGQAVTLVWSGATLPVTPATRIYVVEAENRIYLIAAEGRSYTVPTERRVYAVSA